VTCTERYQTAAADYLHRPLNDPAVVRYARKAQKVADQAALDYLRDLGQRGILEVVEVPLTLERKE